MNTIQDHWDSFLDMVVTKDACANQVEEMRLAFYGGAISILGIQNTLVQRESKPETGIDDEEF